MFIKTNILLFLMFIPFIILGQERDGECVEYEPIEMYNLRKAIIGKQNLDVWPSIVEINLTKMKAEIYCRKEKYAELKIKVE